MRPLASTRAVGCRFPGNVIPPLCVSDSDTLRLCSMSGSTLRGRSGFSAVGKIFRTEGGLRSEAARAKLFYPGGRVQGFPRACAVGAPAPKCPAASAAIASLERSLFRSNFRKSLTAVAGMAQALEIAPVPESLPVSAMWLYMVYLRCAGSITTTGTLSAKGLCQQLGRPQVLCPLLGQVHPMPGLAFLSPGPLGPMELTVTVCHQLTASRMPTGPERLHGHGLSPPSKTKSARAFHTPKGCFMAQALVSVDAGSGASIFTRVSCPHRLHLRGRW